MLLIRPSLPNALGQAADPVKRYTPLDERPDATTCSCPA
jgi:hypothetical protein